jgi:hypothetical protein
MLELIIGASIGALFSLVPLWAYRRGLKDQINIKDNKPIEPIKTPVAVIQEHREAQQTKEESDLITQGLLNILNYNGTPQKKEGEKP